MAVASGAGMFSSMLLTLIVVPLFYLLFDDAADWVKRSLRRASGGKPPVASAQKAIVS